MNTTNNTGLDIDGYIINQASYHLISEDYKIVLDFIIDLLIKSLLNSNIDSIYLYGSIAKGKAIKFQSDLDLIIIITNSSNTQTKILENIKQMTLKNI